jgi:hypothetical protein
VGTRQENDDKKCRRGGAPAKTTAGPEKSPSDQSGGFAQDDRRRLFMTLVIAPSVGVVRT